MTEVWLNLNNVYGLESFDNYEMNEAGVLRRLKTKRTLKGTITKDGYIRFHLKQDGLRKNVLKHRVLAELFVWNPVDLPCVDHQDRNRLNNAIGNLRWCSYEENSRNVSIRKDNKSGEMNISKCTMSNGNPYWRVRFGHHRAGNRHVKYFIRDTSSDVIPDEVIAYRDAYAKSWKGDFNPTVKS